VLSTLIEAITVSIEEDELEEEELDELEDAEEDELEAEDEVLELAALDALLEVAALLEDKEELLPASGPHEAKTKSEEMAITKRIECFLIE
jgi:hypothetical protein